MTGLALRGRKESGYTTGFVVMACGLALAGLAGLLIPSVLRQSTVPAEREHAEPAMMDTVT